MARESCEVAIIGAGPYGLAVGAHLRTAAVETRVFGDPMAFWRRNMPNGMKLRSPWRASTIADPAHAFTLDVFAQANGIAKIENLPLADFVRYGEWFQRRAVPNVDRRMIRSVARSSKCFHLTLHDGDTINAERVIVTMGLTNQEYWPPQFSDLPRELVSHSSAVVDPAGFHGRRIAVVGRGQSACESAVLLSEAGADVELICRGPVRWIGRETDNESRNNELKWLAHKILTAPSAIGPFPFNWLADVPGVLHKLPASMRRRISLRCLRPAASAWLRVRAGGVRVNSNCSVIGAHPKGDKIVMHVDNEIANFDHVVLATGYQTNLSKLNVLTPELLREVAVDSGYPVLSQGFESSVGGLHFVGSPAVGSFGPLPRFVAGAGFAARSVARAVKALRSQAAAQPMVQSAMQTQQR